MAHVNSSVSLGTALLVAAALSVTGCASKDDHPSTPAAGTSPDTSAPSTPDPSTSETTPSTAPTATVSPATLTDRLLATTAVPGLTATWAWQDGDTGAADSTPFGLCAKADLLSIGASQVVQRTYFPPVDTDDNAAEQIAEFPDATTTATAMKVLQSWQKGCATRSTKTVHLKVGAIGTVSGGSEYLVTSTTANPDDAYFQAVGLVTSGNRIAVLTMDVFGKAYKYPAGGDPMAGMVEAAAQLLAS